MKDFWIIIIIFTTIICSAVYGTYKEATENRPASKITVPSVKHPDPAPCVRQDYPQQVKIIERVKVVRVPITKIYIKEVYHSQKVIYVPNGSPPPTQNISYRPANISYTQQSRDNWDEARKQEWEQRKAKGY